MESTGLIDLHHHVVPPALAQALATQIGSGGTAGLSMPPWSREGMVSFMDGNGVAVAVASTGFGVHFGDDRRAAELARRCNDYVAELVRDRPDRFGGFGVLPLPSVDEALTELDRIHDELGLDGVMLSTNYAGVYLGDPAFDRVFDALQARGATVFVHPTESPDAAAHALGVPDFLIDYVADTTRAVTRLHYSNTFARTPDVKYVLSHAGGTVPYIVQRFDLLDSLPAVPGGEQRGSAREQFRRLYWDTAIAFQQPVLGLVRDVIGLDRVVFGSDTPYAPGQSEAGAAAVRGADYLTADERAAIGWRNAQHLLPRLADSPTAR
jgi:aminocarboxymuconate-semialdehyde decarboxylase